MNISEKITSFKNYAHESYTSTKTFLGKPVTWIKEVEWKKGGKKLYNEIKTVTAFVALVVIPLVLFAAKTPAVLFFSLLAGAAFHQELRLRLENVKALWSNSDLFEKLGCVVIGFAALPYALQVLSFAFGASLGANIVSKVQEDPALTKA